MSHTGYISFKKTIFNYTCYLGAKKTCASIFSAANIQEMLGSLGRQIEVKLNCNSACISVTNFEFNKHTFFLIIFAHL